MPVLRNNVVDRRNWVISAGEQWERVAVVRRCNNLVAADQAILLLLLQCTALGVCSRYCGRYPAWRPN